MSEGAVTRMLAGAVVAGALCLLAGLLGTGCARTAEPPRLEDFNILILSIDTMGAEHTGFLNPGRVDTPNLDRLAGESVYFPRAYSPAPWTGPAVASLFTGVMPHRHGVTMPTIDLAAELETLAEYLGGRGYQTGGIISNPLIDARYGYAQGFTDYDPTPIGDTKSPSSKEVSERAIEWLRKRSSSRFFLFLHYFDPHQTLHHHPEFDRTSHYAGPLRPGMDIWKLRDLSGSLTDEDLAYLIGLHHEEIAFTDHHIGRVVEELRTLGLYDDTIVLVVADHGEEFMRHGWLGHTRTLYEELLHVPMILRIGDALPPGRLEMPVSLIDVVPTFRDLARDPVERREWGGRSLLPLLLGKEEPGADREIFGEVSYTFPAPPHSSKTAFKTSLLSGGTKLIHDLPTDTWELYDLAADPEELNDLADRGHDSEATLKKRLAEWEDARRRAPEGRSPRTFEPTPDDIEKLRGLGYIR
jgi:arylsulfatase A-like enzyme